MAALQFRVATSGSVIESEATLVAAARSVPNLQLLTRFANNPARFIMRESLGKLVDSLFDRCAIPVLSVVIIELRARW